MKNSFDRTQQDNTNYDYSSNLTLSGGAVFSEQQIPKTNSPNHAKSYLSENKFFVNNANSNSMLNNSSFNNYTRKGVYHITENQTEKDIIISQLQSQINTLKFNQREYDILTVNHQKLLYE